ncbi:MAG: ribonuclease J, partial [Deltaproteobacteria bacterium]
MDAVKIIPLGGLGEFGLNMMLIEYGDAAIAVDCGLMFPSADLLGIDLVIPDVSYLLERRDRLKAIVLTHAHEDHVGALPYILEHFDVPIFGTRLTLGLLANKLTEHELEDTADVREITAGVPWDIAPFRIEGIRVTHSLMDCLALAIETPIGTIIHTGDFKIDNTPMEGEMFDFQTFAAYGEKGVLLLLSDSTNVERPGYTPSEREHRQSAGLDFFVEHPEDPTGRRYLGALRTARGIERAQHDPQRPGGVGVGILASAAKLHDRKRALAESAHRSAHFSHHRQPGRAALRVAPRRLGRPQDDQDRAGRHGNTL